MKYPALASCVFVALLHVLPALCPVAAVAENVLQNPGFESDKEGWQLFVPPNSKGKVGEFSVERNGTPHEGAACAQCSATDFARYGICQIDGLGVSPKERYRLSAWVRYSDDSVIKDGYPQAFIRATLMQNPQEAIADPLGHIHFGLNGKMARTPNVWKLNPGADNKAWRKIEGVFEVPNGVSLVVPHLFVEGVNGVVYWDEVVLEKVDAGTPLTPDVLAP